MIDFTWLHSPGAFEISPASPGALWRSVDGQWVKEQIPLEVAAALRSDKEQVGLRTNGRKWFDVYWPAKIPTLFQIFADTPHTPEGMRDFFNTYGPLRWAGDLHNHPLDRKALLPPPAGLRDPMELGLEEPMGHHAAFQEAVKLHENGDSSRLTEIFNRGWAQVRTELRPRQNGKVEIAFVPNNLIQFIWLQFAFFAAGDAKLLRCERCSGPMIVGPGTGRRDTSKFCSNACKVATFKERHSHA